MVRQFGQDIRGIWAFFSMVTLSLAASATASQLVTFSYQPPPGAPELESISVPGSFNGWDVNALPLERLPDGSWYAEVELEPGDHEYKFYINDTWPQDMCQDETWGDPARDS